VIDPDKQVGKYGADTVRAYLMFGYRWADGGPWGTENIEGVSRWLNRVWNLVVENPKSRNPNSNADDARALKRVTHQTIKKVTNDFEAYEFNTIVSALMVLTNALYKYRETTEGAPEWGEAVNTLLKLTAPVTPHIAEELWARRGPEYDAAAAAEDVITLVVQVNGKVRDRLTLPANVTEAEARAAALASEAVKKHLDGKPPQKVIYVPGKLVNVVV